VFEDSKMKERGAGGMKAITVLEPWASLIMLNQKHIETRSWKTNYRGQLLIHAGTGHRPWHMDLAFKEPFFSSLEQVHSTKLDKAITYHLGCIIAVCELTDCIKIVGAIDGSLGSFSVPVHKAELENGETIRGNEFYFGDYQIGRYAWILHDIKALEKPIPVKGQQGLWNYEIGNEVQG
jgi:hypothetical protein